MEKVLEMKFRAGEVKSVNECNELLDETESGVLVIA
jgi:hypothetical protein